MTTITNEHLTTGISAVLPLVETTETLVETKTGERKQCKYHINCRKAEEPDHVREFVCQYTKPCRNGLECEKLKGEGADKHKLYFIHNQTVGGGAGKLPFCKYGSRCKKVTDTVHLATYNHKPTVTASPQPKTTRTDKTVRAVRVKKTQLPDTDVQYVSAKFSLNGVAIDGSTHTISSTFKKRLPKDLDSTAVKQRMSASILKRYVKNVTFTKLEFNVVCTVDSVGKEPSETSVVVATTLPGLQTPTPLPVAQQLRDTLSSVFHLPVA